MNQLFATLLLVLSLLLQSCSPEPKKVSGDVFVVTKGGQNFKLGLVEVNVYNHDTLVGLVKNTLKRTIIDAKESVPDSTLDVYNKMLILRSSLENEVVSVSDHGYNIANNLKPIISTKTDADGKFEILLPKGNYALRAHSQRMVVDKTEEYDWIIIFKVQEEMNNQIILSNDNMGYGCTDCVLDFKEFEEIEDSELGLLLWREVLNKE